MRRVTDDQLRTSLTIWIRLAPGWIKRGLLARQSVSEQAEKMMADYIVEKLRMSKHEVTAPEPVTPFSGGQTSGDETR